MSKRPYTLLEYLVALENKVKELKEYVDNYSGTDLENINNQINSIQQQISDLQDQINRTLTLRPVENGEIFVLENNIYGNIVLSTSTLSFNENSSSSFTVKLDSQPTSNQDVNITVSNGNCIVDKSSITFSSDNYNTPQTITVSGVHSSGDYNNTSSIITISSNNVQSKTIEVVLLNIDVPDIPDIPEAGIIQEGLIKSFNDLTATETFANDSDYFTQPFTVVAKCKWIGGNSHTTLGGKTGTRQCYISWEGILNLTLWGKTSNNTQTYPSVKYNITEDDYNIGSTVYIAICMNSDKTVLFYVNNVMVKSDETFKDLVTIDDVEEIVVGDADKNVSWYYYNRALTNEELTQMYNYLGGN